MKNDIRKDALGFDDLDDFWTENDSNTEQSMISDTSIIDSEQSLSSSEEEEHQEMNIQEMNMQEEQDDKEDDDDEVMEKVNETPLDEIMQKEESVQVEENVADNVPLPLQGKNIL